MTVLKSSFREIHFNICIWVTVVIYAIYRFSYNTNSFFKNYNDIYNDFQTGWSFLRRQKDSADDEWETYLQALLSLSVWLFISIFVSNILRRASNCTVLKCWQIVKSFSFVLHEIGYIGITVISAVVLVYEMISKLRSKSVIWFCTMVNLFALCSFESLDQKEAILESIGINRYQYYLLILAVHWIILRCTSYYIDLINCKRQHVFLQTLAYCLYLPLLFFGPFVSFDDFKRNYCNHKLPNITAITELFKNLIRFGFWLFFLEFVLHFIYVNAVEFQPQFVNDLDPWSLYGYGYCMGQFFHIKYVVQYGIATSLSKFEGLSVPNTPRCIGRVHLYSDMWKQFDPGLYKFLTKYIYFPLTKSKKIDKKIFASFICFTFVFIWHGFHGYIFIWATLNFIGLTIEVVFQYLCNKVKHKKSLKSTNPIWKRRFGCIMATPLLAMSAMSNFYFFAGSDIGNIFVRKFFQHDAQTILVILFFLYNCCQVSVQLKNSKTEKNKM